MRSPKLSAAVLLLAALCVASAQVIAAEARLEFSDVEAQTLEFIRYYKEIELSPAQERVRLEALSKIPAACCSDRTAYTCCCECNLSRALWGMSKHLIVNLGADADEVRQAAIEWYGFVNPRGFSGDTCYTGGCNRPFAANGCGGMFEDSLVF